MTMHDDLERVLSGWLFEAATPREVDLGKVFAQTRGMRQRPAWTSPGRWLPVQLTMPRVYIPRAVPILLLIALLVVALLAGALIIGSRPFVPPPFGLAKTGQLVYDANGDILVREPDGRLRSILTGPDVLISPTWSRDGTHLVFWSGSLGSIGELRVANADGTNVRTLASDVKLPLEYMPQSASWSPDSRRVAFSSGNGVLEVVNVDGSDRHVLGTGSLFRFDPAWSPDGQLIAFRGQGAPTIDAPRRVYVIRPDGGGQQEVSRVSIEFNSTNAPNWSPDGRLLYDAVFDLSVPGNHGDIVVATPNGGGWVENIIVGGPTTDWLPRWSNDGTRIVFLRSFVDAEGDQYVANADGSGLRQLSDRAMSTAGACWTPDDTAIAALTGEEGRAINGQQQATYILYEANSGKVLQEVPAPGVQGIIDCSWQRLAT